MKKRQAAAPQILESVTAPETCRPSTPLPWMQWQSIKDNSQNVANTAKEFVCEVGKIGDEDARSDAQYIVRACNAYPKLIEALRQQAPDHKLLTELGENYNKEPEEAHA
jgi:hypothetical protein